MDAIRSLRYAVCPLTHGHAIQLSFRCLFFSLPCMLHSSVLFCLLSFELLGAHWCRSSSSVTARFVCIRHEILSMMASMVATPDTGLELPVSLPQRAFPREEPRPASVRSRQKPAASSSPTSAPAKQVTPSSLRSQQISCSSPTASCSSSGPLVSDTAEAWSHVFEVGDTTHGVSVLVLYFCPSGALSRSGSLSRSRLLSLVLFMRCRQAL